MELRWTPRALADLDEAHAFIKRDKELAAEEVADRILDAVEFLLRHPNLGRAGRVGGTRELVVSGSPFIVVYRVHLDEIQVLRLIHHARRWP